MADQPLFYAREALILLNSPNTRDAFDIQESVNKINQGYIIINMLSLTGSTYLFQQICQKTRGKFEVALNEHDFKQKLMVIHTNRGLHITNGQSAGEVDEHSIHSVVPSACV